MTTASGNYLYKQEKKYKLTVEQYNILNHEYLQCFKEVHQWVDRTDNMILTKSNCHVYSYFPRIARGIPPPIHKK